MNNLEELQKNLKTKSTKFYVDPPSGWMYGFPKVIDLSSEILDSIWLESKGYPKKDCEFGIKWSRLWAKEENEPENLAYD